MLVANSSWLESVIGDHRHEVLIEVDIFLAKAIDEIVAHGLRQPVVPNCGRRPIAVRNVAASAGPTPRPDAAIVLAKDVCNDVIDIVARGEKFPTSRSVLRASLSRWASQHRGLRLAGTALSLPCAASSY